MSVLVNFLYPIEAPHLKKNCTSLIDVMTVFHVFVINRAGSLIYDWENRRAVDPQIAPLSTNEKIVLASVFHSLYTIATQLSPASKSTGIEVLETSQFKLQCFQSITGVKFVVILVNTYTNTQNVEPLLRKIYELYADYALKNPFYSVDMPIRADKFEAGLRALIDRFDKCLPLL